MSNLLDIIVTHFFPLASAFLSMGASQFSKTIIYVCKREKITLYNLMSSGGMPSSHSALVTGLTVGVGLVDGWGSSTFAMCLIFSLVVLYDAAGVRRAVGQQSKVINSVVEDVLKANDFGKMTKVSGHTPFEIFVGIVIGIIVTITLYSIS